MEGDLRTPAALDRTFTNADKMVEMIRRGNGLRDLASKQAVDHAIRSGRGNVDLLLTDEPGHTAGTQKIAPDASMRASAI
jgi:hypothetical protein